MLTPSGDPLTFIGVVHSPRHDPAHTPVQASLNAEEVATVHLDEAYVAGLDGLEAFDHVWLLTWLDGREAPSPPTTPTGSPAGFRRAWPLRQVPYLLSRQPRQIGIFATRGPRRVNPIGLSLAALVSIDGPVVTFRGVDLIDGTPVLDIKPYVTAFDCPPGTPRCGWFDQVDMPVGATPASLQGE